MTLQRTSKPTSAPNHHFHPAAASPSLPKKSSKFDTGRQKGSAIATGFLNMLSGDQPEIAVPEPQPTKRSFVHQENGAPPVPDPWEGLSDGLQIQQNHCFILVKPQIALRSSVDDDSVVIIAAMSTNLMMYGVLDEQDLDDPVNSRVMRRFVSHLFTSTVGILDYVLLGSSLAQVLHDNDGHAGFLPGGPIRRRQRIRAPRDPARHPVPNGRL
jgi:hypothetical protein